jgi:hypothetical protein
MLVTLYVILTVIAFGLIILGYATDEAAYNIIGFVFLFLLNFTVLMTGQVFIETGDYTLSNFSYGSITNSSPRLNQVNMTTITNYTAINDSATTWIARLISLIAALGMVISITEVRKSRKEKDE